ncbi:ATP-dependent protease [Desulfuromonas versatilis]|uniref:endopeptidase La n=1 Tax=Desulfuromonas versatilis TaxID=2802975 RepID=A0ABM8HTS8_9BACT|nr:ATP-binding protein [Desulfuromonas versatilis]BCR04106.1 ATP-dependent protease [Desulfuromonas versatilis]
MKANRLDPQQLSWRCDPLQFEFQSTEELPELEGTIGQSRAMTAIEFGLGIKDSGFNLFLIGEPGSGRSSTIKKLLKARAGGESVPSDWCYLNNFEDATRPRCIPLPAGLARDLHRDVEELVARLAEEIPKVFESKEYEQQKNRISGDYQEKNRKLFQELEEQANEEGFLLQRSVSGMVLVPLRDGHPISQQDYEDLPDEEKAALDEKGTGLQERLNEVLRKGRDLEKELREATLSMEKEILLFAVGHLFEELEQKYQEQQEVLDHFQGCKKDILERIDEFRPAQGPQISLPGLKQGGQEPSFDRYRINLFIDNRDLQGAPVVYEANPTYFNLFGRIEHVIHMGGATTNFTMIKAGALHRANGGYLILDCREVLLNVFSYEALKRCIRNKEVKIEDMAEQFRLFATVSLKPHPVPLKCKIIMIGTPLFYYLLYRLDPDFRKYFKVKADFDFMMKNTWENVQQYALFIGAKCREEQLKHFDPSGVARVVEYSARLIEDKEKLSSRFIDIADLIREASFYAEQQGRERVSEEHVNLAVEAKIYRSNKVEERIQEAIEEGSLLVDTEGEVVGQVNGLSVYLLGDYAFGKPSRVTARTFLGKAGVVNIEREAKLSGPIHDKGLMILSGFLGDRYAQDKPLALAGSVCFEQSYGGVEGDSASSAELYALLSSLAALPLRQEIAVTGSVNQRGQIQPIGGVNEKIEGFYAVCKAKGLTGGQGVIIPVQNVKNLLLKEEVVDAVRENRFHVWAISTVDEGIEILTGVAAGTRQEDGCWPQGSVNQRVDQRLLEMAEAIRRFGKGSEKNGKEDS